MKIYMIPHKLLHKLEIDFNAFSISEWNDSEELSELVKKIVTYCIKNDLVFTLDNFALCFNLQDKETNHCEYCMFISDKNFTNI